MISNPDDVMEVYSVAVTCEVNPTSAAEYCEVIARNDSAAGMLVKSSECYICMYVYVHYIMTYCLEN